jgi:hypothetical protein
MSRTALPLSVGDISAFARALGGQLAGRELKVGQIKSGQSKPSHVELLNMLARAAGFRNYQHLRADAAAFDRLDRTPPAPAPIDHRRVEKVSRYFDRDGLLVQWPARASHQKLCLWVLWSRIPAGMTFAERRVNEALTANHRFGDHALLRRELFDAGLVSRTPDGREYRRIEQKPPAEAITLIRHLNADRAA